MSAKEHKLIPPISPRPRFFQKIFYLHYKFLALNFLLTKQNSANFCITPEYFAPLEAKSVQMFLRKEFQSIVWLSSKRLFSRAPPFFTKLQTSAILWLTRICFSSLLSSSSFLAFLFSSLLFLFLLFSSVFSLPPPFSYPF